jgi:hypothetical protein
MGAQRPAQPPQQAPGAALFGLGPLSGSLAGGEPLGSDRMGEGGVELVNAALCPVLPGRIRGRGAVGRSAMVVRSSATALPRASVAGMTMGATSPGDIELSGVTRFSLVCAGFTSAKSGTVTRVTPSIAGLSPPVMSLGETLG